MTVAAAFGLLVAIVSGIETRAPAASKPIPDRTGPRADASDPPGSPIDAVGDLLEIGRPNLTVFTSKEGLPQNTITSMATDRNGMLWIGTKDGAASYDGRRWHVLNMPPEFGRNEVAQVLCASNGDVWFSVHGGGVARRDESGSWTVFRSPTGIPDDNPVFLCELDEPGRPATVCLVTVRAFARFLKGSWIVDPGLPLVGPGVAGAASLVVADDGVPEIWVGLPRGQSARLRLGVWTVFPSPDLVQGDAFYCFVRTTALTGQPQLVAGRVSGISVFDGSQWSPEPTTAGKKAFLHTSKLCETKAPDGTTALWATAIDGRVARFECGRWIPFAQSDPIRFGGVWSLLATGDANETHALWIGTGGYGLVRLQYGGWTAFDRSTGLVAESIYSLLVTKDQSGSDVAWIGCIKGPLSRIAGGSVRPVTGFDDAWTRCLLDLSEPGIERVAVGRAGTLCIVENGAIVKSFRREEGLPGFDVNALLRSTDAEGRPFLWVGTSGGLCRLTAGGLETAPPALIAATSGAPAGPESALSRPMPGPSSATVTSLAHTQDPDGSRILWIGTQAGLVRYDGSRAVRYTMENGLPSNAILCLRDVRLPDGRVELWVGTLAGVARVPLSDPGAPIGTLTTTSTPPLPNNTVYRIEQDHAGRIYLPTNRGVTRLAPRQPSEDDPAEFGVTVYTTRDGLPNEECNTGASTLDSRGRIWVGTLSGVAVFDPAAEISPSPSTLLVQKQTVVGPDDRRLSANEELAHDHNHVLFEYALISYNREAGTQYRTQMAGIEREPSDWTTEFRREFNSLPAGPYTFRIWGRDAFGNVTGPVEISFRIRTPPWWSWWAILFYVLAIFAVGYAGFRWRLRALAQQNVQLEAAISQRTAELAHTVDELRVSQRAAQEANVAKSVFLANMSHELRTPLNAVLGFAQLLDRTGTLGRQERHQVSIIRRSGEHLLGLINDVLSLAKIEAGSLELHEAPFSPRELLSSVEAMTRVRAEARDLTLDVRIGAGFPPVLYGDDGKLRQILLNLLGNAVKFTPEGGVRLVADYADGRARFEVSDDGPGISAEDLETLFVAFSQTEAGKTATEGTGLGLAISRQIVRLMGGDLTVESVPGHGATFRFDVALQPSAEAAPARISRRVRSVQASERRRRMLVVDDSAENRLLLVSLLEAVGFDVREAGNGREAVDIVVDWRPRVVFMDRRMPVMDGVEATLEIRRLEAESEVDRARVVIIATTASVFEQDREEILANGCNDLIIKPFRETEVFAALERHAKIVFEYESADEPGASRVTRNAAALGRLPGVDAAVIVRLRAALEAGDAVGAAGIAREIGEQDPDLGAAITSVIGRFEFDTLLEAIDAHG